MTIKHVHDWEPEVLAWDMPTTAKATWRCKRRGCEVRTTQKHTFRRPYAKPYKAPEPDYQREVADATENSQPEEHLDGLASESEYRDTTGMDRVYGGQEPPFEVNDDFARTGKAEDY